jgi:hypothetical protein
MPTAKSICCAEEAVANKHSKAVVTIRLNFLKGFLSECSLMTGHPLASARRSVRAVRLNSGPRIARRCISTAQVEQGQLL